MPNGLRLRATPRRCGARCAQSHHRQAGYRAVSAHDFPRLFVNNVSVDFDGVHVDGDRVIVEQTMSATLANGNSYRNDYCFVLELRDGRIHRVREYMDTARGHRNINGV